MVILPHNRGKKEKLFQYNATVLRLYSLVRFSLKTIKAKKSWLFVGNGMDIVILEHVLYVFYIEQMSKYDDVENQFS